MDNETILKLVNAGYTKEEIETMGSGNGAGAPSNESAGNEPAQANEEQGNAGAENESKITDVGQFAGVNAAIENLTNTVNVLQATVKELQSSNIKAAQTKTPAGDAIKAAMDSFIEKL